MLIAMVLLITLSLVGCADFALINRGNTTIVDKNMPSALANSLRTWSKLKRQYGANYSYERHVTTSSGHNNNTILHIEDDRVEYRDYFEWQEGYMPTLSWSESFADLGRHNQGAAIKTIDQLYVQCQQQILSKPRADFSIQLALDQFNILKQCSSIKIACVTDCKQGIRISGLRIPTESTQLK